MAWFFYAPTPLDCADKICEIHAIWLICGSNKMDNPRFSHPGRSAFGCNRKYCFLIFYGFDKSNIRIRLEAEAKFYIQSGIKKGAVELVWSYILDIENDQNPFEDKKNAIAEWKKFAVIDVEETGVILERANVLVV